MNLRATLRMLALVCAGLAACSDSSDKPLGTPIGNEECDPSVVLCRSLPPTCPPDEVPSTSGTCWSGTCVKASACRNVKDCSACAAEWYACATSWFVSNGATTRCVEIPPT